jgi:beta-phosphoglucomutase-like phosphatase (HAD superfamily)
VTDHDGKADKPDPEIDRLAAARVVVAFGRHLSIGEAAGEVRGALSAGLRAIREPVSPG